MLLDQIFNHDGRGSFLRFRLNKESHGKLGSSKSRRMLGMSKVGQRAIQMPPAFTGEVSILDSRLSSLRTNPSLRNTLILAMSKHANTDALLQTLEEKQKIVELLGAYLDAKQEAVRVVIGLDEALPSMRNFVLIGAPARVGDDVMGSLAVIGPTRMDYQHTMTAVSYIARLFDKILNESE